MVAVAMFFYDGTPVKNWRIAQNLRLRCMRSRRRSWLE